MREKIKIERVRKSKLILAAPKLFSVSMGDISGELDLQWDPVPGARFYILQICTYSEKKLTWIQFDMITKSSYTISGLRAGRKYCFRISAVNTLGQGPWSKTIKKSVS